MSEDRLVANRLSRELHKSPSEILAWPTDDVLDALEYGNFMIDYEASYMDLNKDRKK